MAGARIMIDQTRISLTASCQMEIQLFWTLLTVAGEVATASIVIIYIVRHQVRRWLAF